MARQLGPLEFPLPQFDYTLAAIPAQVAATATDAERVHFTALWELSEKLRHQGVIGYYLPVTFAQRMGDPVLRNQATKLSLRVRTDVFYYLDLTKSALYIGQILDVNSVDTLVHVVNLCVVRYPKRLPFVSAPINSTQGPLLAPAAFQAAVNGINGVLPVAAPYGNLGSALLPVAAPHGNLGSAPLPVAAPHGNLGTALSSAPGPASGSSNVNPLTNIGKKDGKKGSKTRRARLRDDHIPKPRNSWIIFRQDHHGSVVAEHPEYSNGRISVHLSNKWRDALPEVKAKYKKLADDEKAEHRAKYPLYKLTPRKSSEIKKRKRSGQQDPHNLDVLSELEVPVFDGRIVIPDVSGNGSNVAVGEFGSGHSGSNIMGQESEMFGFNGASVVPDISGNDVDFDASQLYFDECETGLLGDGSLDELFESYFE